MRISVIVPALDEAGRAGETLAALQPVREQGEIILVDGGSRDGTAEKAAPLADRVMTVTPPGRARQMNAGAGVANGDILWFVHADTRVDAEAVRYLQRALDSGAEWGRFDVRMSSPRLLLRVVAWTMNQRSRATGIATGDQGIFVRRTLFNEVGGFPEQPLMEDIALSAALRARCRPACLPVGLTTSSRRWEEGGILRTILLMWRLRWAYWRGTPPSQLAARYRGRAA